MKLKDYDLYVSYVCAISSITSDSLISNLLRRWSLHISRRFDI